MTNNKEKILKMREECKNKKSCDGCHSIYLCKSMPAKLGDMRLRPMFWGDMFIDMIVGYDEDEIEM